MVRPPRGTPPRLHWDIHLDPLLGRVTRVATAASFDREGIVHGIRDQYCPRGLNDDFTASMGKQHGWRFRANPQNAWQQVVNRLDFSAGHVVAAQFIGPQGFFNYVTQTSHTNESPGCYGAGEMVVMTRPTGTGGFHHMTRYR